MHPPGWCVIRHLVFYTYTNVLYWISMMGNHILLANQEWIMEIWNGQSYDQKLKEPCQTWFSSLTLSHNSLYEWRFTKSFVMGKTMQIICVFQFFMLFYGPMPWKTGGFSCNFFCQELSEEGNLNVRNPQVLSDAASSPVNYSTFLKFSRIFLPQHGILRPYFLT